jgi:hypothetical protein
MDSKTLLPTPEEMRRYLSTRGAALYLHLSARWLEELRQDGGGPEYFKPAKKKVLYSIEDLDAWIRQYRRRNTSSQENTEVEEA